MPNGLSWRRTNALSGLSSVRKDSPNLYHLDTNSNTEGAANFKQRFMGEIAEMLRHNAAGQVESPSATDDAERRARREWLAAHPSNYTVNYTVTTSVPNQEELPVDAELSFDSEGEFRGQSRTVSPLRRL